MDRTVILLMLLALLGVALVGVGAHGLEASLASPFVA
jgi:hypothetical protein